MNFQSLKDVIINQSIYESEGRDVLCEDDLNLAGESAQLSGLRTAGLWGSKGKQMIQHCHAKLGHRAHCGLEPVTASSLWLSSEVEQTSSITI